jgi:hypothetical protein
MEKAYAHHRVTGEASAKILTIRTAFSQMQLMLKTLCPASRELSIALTELETSAMWTMKALAHNDPNSKVEGE